MANTKVKITTHLFIGFIFIVISKSFPFIDVQTAQRTKSYMFSQKIWWFCTADSLNVNKNVEGNQLPEGFLSQKGRLHSSKTNLHKVWIRWRVKSSHIANHNLLLVRLLYFNPARVWQTFLADYSSPYLWSVDYSAIAFRNASFVVRENLWGRSGNADRSEKYSDC